VGGPDVGRRRHRRHVGRDGDEDPG
jgi:hypothetical protein